METKKISLDWITDLKQLPKTPHKLNDAVHSSDTLLIINKGVIVPGVYLQYQVDINGVHQTIKKGDGLFADMHDTILSDVTGYYLTKDIELPQREEKPKGVAQPRKRKKAEPKQKEPSQ